MKLRLILRKKLGFRGNEIFTIELTDVILGNVLSSSFMMKKNLFLIFFSLVALVSSFFSFLFHTDPNLSNLEGITEVSYYLLMPFEFALIFSIMFGFKFFSRQRWILYALNYFGILMLSAVVFMMSAHTGNRSAVSFLEHPDYLITLLFSAAFLVYISYLQLSYDEQK